MEIGTHRHLDGECWETMFGNASLGGRCAGITVNAGRCGNRPRLLLCRKPDDSQSKRSLHRRTRLGYRGVLDMAQLAGAVRFVVREPIRVGEAERAERTDRYQHQCGNQRSSSLRHH